MSKPISPSEVDKAKSESIPDFVFDVVNALIAERFDGNRSVITSEEIVSELQDKHNISREECFKKNYLDIEQSYRDAGWGVQYDQPTYCETFKAFFVFSKKEIK